jgi:2-polyprenyl-6-methoxyphenol hydroxylase-like FAD-dependent oxidoreductase
MIETDVLIVGGSLVGLSAATFLAWHGVPTLSVERHDGTAIHPRAGHFHLRTLEVFRSVGLEERVRAASEEHSTRTAASTRSNRSPARRSRPTSPISTKASPRSVLRRGCS